MKIAIFTDAYPPYVSGVATMASTQAIELAERGHKVMVFCPKFDNSNKIKQHNNIKVINLSFNLPFPEYKEFKLAVPTTIKSLNKLHKFQPDIIHCHSEAGVGIEGTICAHLLKVPLVTTFHTMLADEGSLKIIHLDNSEIFKKTVWKYLTYFHSKADITTCPSIITKKELYQNGFKKKIFTLPNCIDLDKFTEAKNNKEQIKNVKKKFNLTNFAICYVGRVSPDKDINILLKSFQIICKEFPKTKLLIIGEGPSRDEMINLSKTLGIDKNVIFTGSIPRDQLISESIIPSCDLFVTASKTENQPMVIIEAMASGLPVIGVDKTGVTELIEHNNNGFLAKHDNPTDIASNIKKLIKDRSLCKKMGGKSSELAKKFSTKETTNQLEKIYFNLKQKSV